MIGSQTLLALGVDQRAPLGGELRGLLEQGHEPAGKRVLAALGPRARDQRHIDLDDADGHLALIAPVFDDFAQGGRIRIPACGDILLDLSQPRFSRLAVIFDHEALALSPVVSHVLHPLSNVRRCPAAS